MPGVDFDGFTEFLQGSPAAAQFSQYVALAVPGLRVPGVDFSGSIECLQGLPGAAQIVQREAPANPGTCELRVDFYGLIVSLQSLLLTALLEQLVAPGNPIASVKTVLVRHSSMLLSAIKICSCQAWRYDCSTRRTRGEVAA